MTASPSAALSTRFDAFEAIRHTIKTRDYFKALCDHFFQSQLERIESETYALLSMLLSRYTEGESSSVPISFAENVLTSILYAIGIGLKGMSVREAVSQIKENTVTQLFECGQRRIQIKNNSARHRYREVLKTQCPINNQIYQATVRGGIRGFFKLYDPVFAAHEIHITADYPTASPRPVTEGIEFIIDYLDAIYLENCILDAFPKEAVIQCLHQYHRHYAVMVINLLDIVIVQALGCLFAGRPPHLLSLSAADIARLYTMLSAMDSLTEGVHRAIASLVDLLGLSDARHVVRYLYACESEFLLAFQTAVETDTLEKRLCITRAPVERNTFYIDAAEAVSLTDYRKLFEELTSCRYPEDQCQLLLKDVRHFRDFENLLLDTALPQSTCLMLFSALPVVTVAALFARHPLAPTETHPEDDESDRLLRQALSAYRQSLSPDERLSLDNLTASVIFTKTQRTLFSDGAAL